MKPPAADRDTGAEEAAVLLVTRLAAGQFDEAVATFDEAMAKAFPAARAAATWNQLIAQLGPYASLEVSAVDHKDDLVRVTVATRFERATMDLFVVLTPSREITGFFVKPHAVELPWSAPPYAVQGAFTEVETTVGEGALALPGTLSLPSQGAAGKLPAVVLVHGSGPNDRDETVGAARPFKDLAWGLASRGIAVLRYEKVTRAHGPALAKAWGDDITLARDTIDDALAAVRVLRAHPRVDPERVFYLGHSQGAYAAPRAGERDRDLAGLVLLAAPTRPLEDVALRQVEYLATLDGPNAEACRAMIPALRAAASRVKSPSLARSTPRSELPLGIPAPFWLDVRGYRPEEVAAGLTTPILVLHGEADYQVDQVDFAGWQAALRERADATTKSYPRLTHLFVDCGSTTSTPADYQKPGNVAAEVVGDIATWIAAR